MSEVTSITKSLDRIADALDSSNTDSGLTGSIKRIAKAIDSESDTKSITDSLDAIADYIEENGIGGGESGDGLVEVTISNAETSVATLYIEFYEKIDPMGNPSELYFHNIKSIGAGETATLKVLANSFVGINLYDTTGSDPYGHKIVMTEGTAKTVTFESDGVTIQSVYFDADGQTATIEDTK